MMAFSVEALRWLEEILEERFGHFFLLKNTASGLRLSIVGIERGYILFPSSEKAFQVGCNNVPCTYWDAESEGWNSVLDESIPAPGSQELRCPLIECVGDYAVFHYDIFGFMFWMLNRIEEVGNSNFDRHGRFSATRSHAYINNYLERPVVDEWLHVLEQVILRVWPNLRLKELEFSMKVSHDVDFPSLYAFKSWRAIAIMMVRRLLKQGDLKATLQAPFLKLVSGKAIHTQDPFNTFEWLMDFSESNNLTSAFYFICGTTSGMDADYVPEDTRIVKLMRRIYERGHEIGLHPSYGTYQQPELIKREAERLRQIMREAAIEQTDIGGRMHYLRWEHPGTLQAWEDAGMAYDTTLSYADHPGFRCGTCHEYPAFNPITQKRLSVRIRPLIVMECTVIAERYMDLGYTDAAVDKFLALKERCRKVRGCYTLLWHNSHFSTSDDFRLYRTVVNA